MNTTRHTESVEVILKNQRRRRWFLADKSALVRRTYEPGMSVSLVARQEGVATSLLFQWRKLERQGALTVVFAGEVVPLGIADVLVCHYKSLRQAAASASGHRLGNKNRNAFIGTPKRTTPRGESDSNRPAPSSLPMSVVAVRSPSPVMRAKSPRVIEPCVTKR